MPEGREEGSTSCRTIATAGRGRRAGLAVLVVSRGESPLRRGSLTKRCKAPWSRAREKGLGGRLAATIGRGIGRGQRVA